MPSLPQSGYRAARSTIREHLLWAFGYNVALIHVAIGQLYPFAAGIALAIRSLSMVLNAPRPRRFKSA